MHQVHTRNEWFSPEFCSTILITSTECATLREWWTNHIRNEWSSLEFCSTTLITSTECTTLTEWSTNHIRNKWFSGEFCSTILSIWRDRSILGRIMETYIAEEEIKQWSYPTTSLISTECSTFERLREYDNRNEWFSPEFCSSISMSLWKSDRSEDTKKSTLEMNDSQESSVQLFWSLRHNVLH